MKARKGDVVLVVRTTHDYVIGKPRKERTDATFGLVASATRDGIVKTWRGLAWGEDLLHDHGQPVRSGDRVFVLPAAEFDVDGLLSAAKAHHWPNHPNQPMPFDSIDEARELARPFRKEIAA